VYCNDVCQAVHIKVLVDVVVGDVSGEYGSVVRPQVPQYVTLQILAILQPYPQERDTRDQCISADLGEFFFTRWSVKQDLLRTKICENITDAFGWD